EVVDAPEHPTAFAHDRLEGFSPVERVVDVLTDGDVAPQVLRGTVEVLEHVRVDVIVPVDESDELTPGVTDAEVARIAEAAVRFDEADDFPGVAGSVLVDQRLGAVG